MKTTPLSLLFLSFMLTVCTYCLLVSADCNYALTHKCKVRPA